MSKEILSIKGRYFVVSLASVPEIPGTSFDQYEDALKWAQMMAGTLGPIIILKAYRQAIAFPATQYPLEIIDLT